jgi:hypothetical protein
MCVASRNLTAQGKIFPNSGANISHDPRAVGGSPWLPPPGLIGQATVETDPVRVDVAEPEAKVSAVERVYSLIAASRALTMSFE